MCLRKQTFKHTAWDAEIRYTAEATGKWSAAVTCDAVRSEEQLILKNILEMKLASLTHTHPHIELDLKCSLLTVMLTHFEVIVQICKSSSN